MSRTRVKDHIFEQKMILVFLTLRQSQGFKHTDSEAQPMPCYGGYLCSHHACPILSTWDCTGAVPHLYILQVPAFSLHSKSRVTNPTVECDPPLSICWRFPDLHNAKGEKLKTQFSPSILLLSTIELWHHCLLKLQKDLEIIFFIYPLIPQMEEAKPQRGDNKPKVKCGG